MLNMRARAPRGLPILLLGIVACSSSAPGPDGQVPAPPDPGGAAPVAPGVAGEPALAPLAGDEEWVSFYPTYAFPDGDEWVIPVSYRVHEDRSWLGRVLARVASSLADPDEDELRRFRTRIHDFVTDSESREVVWFVVEGDPAKERLRLEDERGLPIRTGLNGLARGTVSIAEERMREIRANGGAEDGWVTLRAVSPGHHGAGRVQVVEGGGLSVISDIDDTVKRTGIPAGARVVIEKTFFRPWEAAPGMAELFRDWEGEEGPVAWHYVSAGPWQLHRHLAGFLFGPEAGFPEGSLHMRDIRKHPLSLRTWRDLYGLVTDEAATYSYKVEAISRIVEHFPERDFILVGDSGEHDPEVYRTVQERFPERIREVVIRDVVEARTRAPERLEGMTVIPAEDLTRLAVLGPVPAPGQAGADENR